MKTSDTKLVVMLGIVILLAVILIPLIDQRITQGLIGASGFESEEWTTTAHFDSGTKSDPGNLWFAQNGVDQPMNWINYPAAVYGNGRTYVVWQGDTDFSPYISAYDHAAATWSSPVRIRNDNPLAGTSDGHGAPAITIGSDGRLHVFCCSHDTELLYSRSLNAFDISTWTTMLNPVTQATYPHPVLMGNTLYIFYRATNCCFGPWAYRSSTDHGDTWGANPVYFSDYAYFGGMEASGNNVHMVWVNQTSAVLGTRQNAYAAYFNTDDLNMYCKGNPSDVNLGTAISQAEADASCLIENTGTDRSNFGAIHLDASAIPFVIYAKGTSAASTDWNFRFSRWTGLAWSAPVNIRSTDHQANYGDFLVRNSTSLEAFLTTPGLSLTGGDIERWTWDGATWTSAETILKQIASSKPLIAPLVPRGFQESLRVVFDQTDFINATRVGSRMYAWGSGGFVMDVLSPSGVFASETITDDGQVPANATELSSGKGDTFAFADSDGNTSRWNSGFRSASAANLCSSQDIGGGVARASATSLLTTECLWSSTFTVSGNFDLRIKTSTPIDGTNRRLNLCVVDEPVVCSGVFLAGGGVDGFIYGNDLDGILNAFNISGGIYTQIGLNTVSLADPIWLRIDRTGNTFSFRFSTDGSSYTLDETHIRNDAPSSFIVTFSYVQEGVTDGTGNFDDYALTAGTVDLGGFRPSGSWNTPAFDTVGNPVRTITLNHSSLTATYAIDRVQILSGSNVLQTFETDIISGTSTTLNVTGNIFGSDIHARITLKGDTAGTGVLERVYIEATGSSFDPISAPASTLLRFIPILLVVAIVVTVVLTYRE